MSALWYRDKGESGEADVFTDLCKAIVKAQPGARRPISDGHAASLAPGVLTLSLAGHVQLTESLLRDATKWICDRYEASESGLAGPYAAPDDEVRILLAAPFASEELPVRHESLTAVALADLSYYVAPGLYADIVNDFKAVGIIPSAVHGEDAPASYVVAKHGTTRPLLNIAYPEIASSARLPHHLLIPNNRQPEILQEAA